MIIIDTTVDWPGIGASLAGKMAWLDRDLTIVDRPLRIENIVCQKSPLSLTWPTSAVCPRTMISGQMQAHSAQKETLDTASSLPSHFGRSPRRIALPRVNGRTGKVVRGETLFRATGSQQAT